MKKIIAICIFSLIAFACSSKKEGNMIVQGQIKGLKKGTLYLQKMKDTLLVSVDSIKLLGKDSFILVDNVESPEMYYLTFDGNTTDKRILFFGDKGMISIYDDVENFGVNPSILGSINQSLLDKYNIINKEFLNQRLEFIKKDFDAKKEGNQELVSQLEEDYKKLLRKRLLFTTNFAITYSEHEVAPYLGLTELYDATLPLLDTVNNSLSDKVKNSLYGKRFQRFIDDIKKKQ